jgi:hypothetical protein
MKTTANNSSATIITPATTPSFASVVKWAKRAVLSCQPLTRLAEMASQVIEKEVTRADMLRIISLCFSICFAVFPVDMPFVLRIIAILWMGASAMSLKSFDE